MPDTISMSAPSIPNSFAEALEGLRKHANTFERIVDCFAKTLGRPIFYESGLKHAGFRYTQPTPKTFCILKAVSTVNNFNACLVLAENGFAQQVCILIRLIYESLSHVQYIIAGLSSNGELSEKQAKFVEAYFADYLRNGDTDVKPPQVRQEDIHREISKFLNSVPQVPTERGTEDAMYNIYKIYSNYVHGRYPELMDLMGGTNPHFHMNGMLETPKDYESFLILDTFVTSIKHAFRFMVWKFDMAAQLSEADLQYLRSE